jgi:phosphoribosyl-ATP pyrophosphohydrolase
MQRSLQPGELRIPAFNHRIFTNAYLNSRLLAKAYTEDDGYLNPNLTINQVSFKTLCWNITEELGELMEAYRNGHRDAFLDELNDVMSFSLALLRYVSMDDDLRGSLAAEISLPNMDNITNDRPYPGLGRQLVYSWPYGFTDCSDEIEKTIGKLTVQLGLTSNLLKNRPWRKSNYEVDLSLFTKGVVDYVELLFSIHFVKRPDWDSNAIINAIESKTQTNLFRIRSGY